MILVYGRFAWTSVVNILFLFSLLYLVLINVFCDIFRLLDATRYLKVALVSIFFHLYSSYDRVYRMRISYFENNTAPTHVPIIMNITIICYVYVKINLLYILIYQQVDSQVPYR